MNWYKLSSRVLRYPPDLVAICKEVVQQVPEVTDKLEKGDTKYIGRKEITSPYNKDKITVDFQISKIPTILSSYVS